MANNNQFDFRAPRRVRSLDGIFVSPQKAPISTPKINQPVVRSQSPTPRVAPVPSSPPVQKPVVPPSVQNVAPPKTTPSPTQQVINFQPLLVNKKAETEKLTREIKSGNFFEMPLEQEYDKDHSGVTAYYQRFVIVGASLFIMIGMFFSGNSLAKNAPQIEKKVYAESKDGEALLNSAQAKLANFDFAGAEKDFSQASENFKKVENEVSRYGQNSILLSQLPKNNSQISNGVKMVSVAKDVSLAGKELCLIEDDLKGLSILDQKEITDWNSFSQVAKHLEKAKNNLTSAQIKMSKIGFAGIPQMEKTITELKNKLPELQKTLELALQTSKTLPKILGKDKKQDYLILFQNPAEARATGGFLGNYGILSFNKGQMIGPKVDDIYKLKWLNWGKEEFVLKPPQEVYDADIKLWQKSKWEIWDANWYADFPTSAQTIQTMYEQSTKEMTDGVISLDPVVFSEILKVIGPIRLPKYHMTATDKNFWRMMEIKVEADNPFKKGLATYGEANPKQILKDFAPIFMARIKNATGEKKNQIFKTLIRCIQEKHIILYASDANLGDLLSYLNVNGQIKNTPLDYLYFNESNVGLNKSSNRIKQSVELNVKIENGQIKNQLILFRKHFGDPTNQREGKNISYFRFLVPSGAQLNCLTVNGKDFAPSVVLGQESGKTKFGVKVWLAPQKSQRIILEYTLPFKVNLTSLTPFNYSLYVQKQPGRVKDGLTVNLNLSKDIFLTNISGPVEAGNNQNNIVFKTDLLQDRLFGVTLKK